MDTISRIMVEVLAGVAVEVAIQAQQVITELQPEVTVRQLLPRTSNRHRHRSEVAWSQKFSLQPRRTWAELLAPKG